MPADEVTPEISILTPSLNYTRFLPDALDSVEGQQVGAQHIVQDGGSTDGTIELLEGRDLEWRSEPDAGQSDALNRALARATGRWVGWLNADEFYLPGGLRTLIEAGDAGDADVIHGDLILVDEQGALVKLRSQHSYSDFAMRRSMPHIATCAMIIRRDFLEDVRFDGELGVAMDWDLYLRLRDRGATFRYVPYPVGAFRLHGAQVTAERDAWLADADRLTAKHGISRSRTSQLAGLGVHRAIKIANGAFLRQFKARPLRGTDMRWFRDEVGSTGANQLLRRSYASSANRERASS